MRQWRTDIVRSCIERHIYDCSSTRWWGSWGAKTQEKRSAGEYFKHAWQAAEVQHKVTLEFMTQRAKTQLSSVSSNPKKQIWYDFIPKRGLLYVAHGRFRDFEIYSFTPLNYNINLIYKKSYYQKITRQRRWTFWKHYSILDIYVKEERHNQCSRRIIPTAPHSSPNDVLWPPTTKDL